MVTARGALSFDPLNKAQVKLAIKIAGVRTKRKLSPDVRAKRIQALARARLSRQNPTVERQLAIQERRLHGGRYSDTPELK